MTSDEIQQNEQDISDGDGFLSLMSEFVPFREAEHFLDLAADRSIYLRKLDRPAPLPKYKYVPHTIYLYIAGMESDGRVFVKHYQETRDVENPIPYDSVGSVVQDMLNRISNGSLRPDTDSNFRNIRWKHKSYIVFVLDEEYWTLQTMSSELPPVRFKTRNHSFFDAQDLTVTLDAATASSRARSAVLFVNHMKKDGNGNNLEEPEIFQFELIFSMSFAGPPHGWMIVIFDPDGTNVGPPLPPPEEP
jgi:hypothetical protein